MVEGRRFLLTFERLLLVAGGILLLIYVSALLHRVIGSRLALRDFDKAQATLVRTESITSDEFPGDEKANFSLWSKNRIRAYQDSLYVKKDLPIAVLRVERLNIRVAVFEGTDNLALNRGVGWIVGTARPGEAGNIGIAGHRDGFFRGLKDLSSGDVIELSTPGAKFTYAVEHIEIVNPDNVGVLGPRGVPSLTLVTCYPFYFVGDAPQRFILHAALKQQAGDSSLSFDNKEKGK
jgi:sortase A